MCSGVYNISNNQIEYRYRKKQVTISYIPDGAGITLTRDIINKIKRTKEMKTIFGKIEEITITEKKKNTLTHRLSMNDDSIPICRRLQEGVLYLHPNLIERPTYFNWRDK